MADKPEAEEESEIPQIFSISRRTFFRRTAAGAIGGLALRETPPAEAKSQTSAKKDSTKSTASRVRQFIAQQPFLSPPREVFPVLDGDQSRLIAISEGGWLALWSFDQPNRPRHTGSGDCCPPPTLAKTAKGFRAPEGKPFSLAESGLAIAWYKGSGAVAVEYKDHKGPLVTLPKERGTPLCLGLGINGEALAVGYDKGGILVFDLRGGAVKLVGEFHDGSLQEEFLCAEQEPCSRGQAMVCACDLVSAMSEARESTTISQYDSRTGSVTSSTAPCGTPLPPNAICLCNCVRSPARTIAYEYCSCDQVCSCDTVCTCNTVSTTYTYTYTYTYWYPN